MIVSQSIRTVMRKSIRFGSIGILLLGAAMTGALADEVVPTDISPPAPEHQCDRLAQKAYSFSWEEEHEALKPPDLTAARASCHEAVRDHPGEPRFEYQLGWAIGDLNFDEAMRWALNAAEQGYAPAQHRVGELTLFGHGFEKDPSEGLRWLHEAAEQGFAPSSAMLANVYILGLAGIEIDAAESARWARAAAVKGHADAQYLSGQLLRQGIGVPTNETEAQEWFLKAQAQGNRDAAAMAKYLTDKLRAQD